MKHLFRAAALLALFCCAALALPAGAAAAQDSVLAEPGYDVRKTRWGMSLEEIKKSEKGPMFGKPEYSKFSQNTKIRYRDQIFGVWCDIDYCYNPKTGLFKIYYYFVPQPYDEAKKLFDTLSDTFAETYANPDNSRKSLYAAAHEFTNDRTAITLSRNSAGPSKRIVLTFYSIDYWDEMQEGARRRAAEAQENPKFFVPNEGENYDFLDQ